VDREQLHFEKKQVRDDDPFVTISINSALHEYLIGNVSIDMIKKYQKLPDKENICNLYLDSLKEKFLKDISLFTLINHENVSAYFVESGRIDFTKMKTE